MVADVSWKRILDHLPVGLRVVDALLAGKQHYFPNRGPYTVPHEKGVYVFRHVGTGEILRAGKAERQTLYTRVVTQHVTGHQSGNLPAQLCAANNWSFSDAQAWIRQYCIAQCLTESELQQLHSTLDIGWAEAFLLALLHPTY